MSATYCPPVTRVESAGVARFPKDGAEQAVEVLRARSAQVAVAGGVETEGLLECLAKIPDPRDRRGVRYALASVLALCLAAVLCGEKTREDITAWAAAAPRWLLAAVGIRQRRGRLRAPHADTVERVLNAVDAKAADQAIGGWFAVRAGLGVVDTVEPDTVEPAQELPVLLVDGEPAAVAVDGKAMAGAVDAATGRAAFLLAAVTHSATSVLAQAQIGPKSNEIPSFAPLLAGLELTGVVVTADSLHTQRAHARFLVEVKRAHFVLIVKDNQPKLFDALDALAWQSVEIGHRTEGRGHGRHEVRTIQAMDAPDTLGALFPHVKQVFLVERHVTRRIRCRRRGSGRYYTKVVKTAVAVLGVTSLTAAQATPAQLAALVRGHWSIEALHLVRDVTFREDDSRITTGSRPRMMATLRNTTIGLIRQSGTRKIAATIRKLKHDPHRLLAVLGLQPHPQWAPDQH